MTAAARPTSGVRFRIGDAVVVSTGSRQSLRRQSGSITGQDLEAGMVTTGDGRWFDALTGACLSGSGIYCAIHSAAYTKEDWNGGVN